MLPRTLEPRGRAAESTEPWSKPSHAYPPTHATATAAAHQNPPQASLQSHDPAMLKFPDVPTTELPPIQPSHETDNTLPSISSLTGQRYRRSSSQLTDSTHSRQASAGPQQPWMALSPRSSHYSRAADSPARMDLDAGSNGAVGAASPDYFHDGRASSVSLDDPDVRLAAEALGDLRAGKVASLANLAWL